MANYTSTHSGAVIDAAVTKITATSSSATELNILDGVTATTAEINILDGVTSTTAELNILDGVTATTAEINYIDGVTSNIQTQLNLKAPLAGASLTGTTSFQNLSDGTITITAFADEDDMSSNSATLIPTQQSVKAYVDTTAQTTEEVQDIVGAMFSSNTESGITVTYEDGDGTIDLSVATQSDNNFTTTLKNKLDAIEASATADQTASEIRTLVESASDSNVFTDDDHSKLNAIEASATADQTNAEIRTAVEAASDSNVFTDADHSKLNAIEASADVTDTANVTSAGALMDSELASIADVKALDQSVVSGASPTFGTANMSDASNKRFMTDAQETKLDSVESNADVTDTANVTSAGALMDSELTDLAGVKGVTISTLQAKPSEGAFANGDKTKLDAIESGATADQTDEEIQDVVGAMFSSNTETGITATYQDGDGTIDLVVGTLNQDTTGNAATATKIASITNSDIVQLTSSQTLTNKTLTSPVINTGISGSAILDEDDMTSNSATKLSTQQSIKAYVDAEVAGVVDTAPAALNTLNELAAALGDDANFSTTTSTALGNRLRVDTASQGLNGTQQANAITNLGITSTKAELNILDGVTATATELNLIDGVTATTAELNILDGVTSTAAELNILDGVTATAAELNIMDGVTATTAELNYVDGVTSNIQTQLDATLDTAGTGIDISSTTVSVDVSDFMANGADNRIVTATGTDAMNAESNLTFDGTDLAIASTGKLYFDGGNNTYFTETASDLVDMYVGGVLMMRFEESGTDSVFTNDNVHLAVGVHKDLRIYHNSSSTNNNIENHSGSLYITNEVDDADIIFRTDDGSGGVTAYLTLDGSATKVQIDKNMVFSDNVQAQFGGNVDLRIYSDDSNSYIDNENNDLIIQNDATDKDIIFKTDDGSGGVTAYLTLDGSVGRLEAHKDIKFADSVDIHMGTHLDLKLYHDGSNSYIDQNGTGDLIIQQQTADKDIIFKSDDGSGGLATYLTLDGSATTINVAKNLDIGDGADNVRVRLGEGQDLQLGHDGTNSFISNSTGNLDIKNFGDDKDIILYNDDGGGGTTPYITLDGSTGHLNLTPPNNVGIGTTSPSTKLTVDSGTSGTHQAISVERPNSSVAALFIGTKGNSNDAAIAANNSNLTFGKDVSDTYTEYMRIDTSGNVLIGGTSASGHGFNLEVLNDHAYVKGPDGWDGNGDKAIVALGSAVSNESFGCGYVYGTGLVLSTYKPSGGGDFGSSTQNSLEIADTTGVASFINDVIAFASSDKRLKENVKPLDNALDKINKINGVEFDWIDGKDEYGNSVHSNTGHDVGVIAQEIEEVLPEVVTTRDNGYKAVKYEKIVPLLIEAIKEQQKQIEELRNG